MASVTTNGRRRAQSRWPVRLPGRPPVARPRTMGDIMDSLLGFARRHLNHDHRWRAPLNEAVYPV